MLMLIDGHNMMHRAHWAYRHLSIDEHTPTGMIYGFLVMTLTLIKKYKPKDLIICFDGGSGKRKLIDPNYKSNRMPLKNGFFQQYVAIVQLLKDLGMKQCLVEGEEADDVIATLAQKLKSKDKVIIVSGDHDFLQLIDDNILVLRAGSDDKIYDKQMVKEKYGVEANQLYDLLCLTGDGSDNVSGIKNMGVKKAAKLINEYGNIDEIISKSGENPKLQAIKDNVTILQSNKKVIKLNYGIDTKIDSGNKNLDLVKDMFHNYFKFESLIKRWDEIENLSAIGGQLIE